MRSQKPFFYSKVNSLTFGARAWRIVGIQTGFLAFAQNVCMFTIEINSMVLPSAYVQCIFG